MGCCRNKSNNKNSCCCKNKGLNEQEYKELKEHFKEDIKDFRVVDYMDENGSHRKLIEVELNDYILELDNINLESITLDDVIDLVIKNSIK